MSSVDFPQVSRLVSAPEGVAGNATATIVVPDAGPAVPSGGSWQIAAVSFRIVTSATAVTRTPVLQVLDGSGVAIAITSGGFGVTASLTTDYAFVMGLGEWDFAGTAFASGPAPAVPLDPGDTITLSISAGVAGDAVSRIRVTLVPR